MPGQPTRPRNLAMFRNVLNTLRKSRRPTTPATPRKVRLHLEGLEERACPASLQQYAAALDHEVATAATQFANDAATVEYQSPTAMSRTIHNDLVQIYNDAQVQATVRVFNDLQQLGRDVTQEANYVQQYRLPTRYALQN